VPRDHRVRQELTEFKAQQDLRANKARWDLKDLQEIRLLTMVTATHQVFQDPKDLQDPQAQTEVMALKDQQDQKVLREFRESLELMEATVLKDRRENKAHPDRKGHLVLVVVVAKVVTIPAYKDLLDRKAQQDHQAVMELMASKEFKAK